MATDIEDLRSSRLGDSDQPQTTVEEAATIRQERIKIEASITEATAAVRLAEERRSDLYGQLVALRRKCGHPRKYYAGNGIDHCPDCGLND